MDHVGKPFEPLIWITGLPGSGKTTLAKQLAAKLRSCGKVCVELDGDELRRILGKEDKSEDYTRETRLELASIYARLAQSLNAQGITVIVSTVSLFWAIHEENRKSVSDYFEVFLDVDLDLLQSGPRETLYTNGLVGNFVLEFPKNPDLVLKATEASDRQNWSDQLFTAISRAV